MSNARMNGDHIRQPIGHTCPAIDIMLSKIEKALKLCRVNDRYTVEELLSAINDIENEIYITREIEELRSANHILREWGKEEANRVDELEQEIEDINIEKNYQRDFK